MKKYLIVSIILAIILPCLAANTVSADVVGHIYSTDILAFVNNKPIEGFNIGGKTVIIAEDLNYYGFNHEYNEEKRELKVYSYFNDAAHNEFKEIQRGKTGKVVGEVYSTDITVTFNGLPIEGYNIGGRTAICIEDLGELADSKNDDYGYSKYLAKHIWDEENRTISLFSFIDNMEAIKGISRVNYKFVDNCLYVYQDEFSIRSEILQTEPYYSEGFDKNSIKPLYLEVNGEKTEIGLTVRNLNYEDIDSPIIFVYDVEQARGLIKKGKSPKKSHDEAVEYFSTNYNVVEKLESSKYTALKIINEEEGRFFVYINKNGGYVVDTFMQFHEATEEKMWFEGDNVFVHSMYPFGGPHGTTTIQWVSELDTYDYD